MKTMEAPRGIRIRKTAGDRWFDRINMAFLLLVLAIVIYPLYLIIISSVSEPGAIIAGRVLLWPVDFSLIGYTAVFQYTMLWTSYANAVYYTLAGSALSVIITLAAAYALSRRFAGKKFFNIFILFTMFFSGGLIPIFLNVRDLHLYNTRMVMIVLNCVSVWNLMVARTYIQTAIPHELYEAAVMDGASHYRYFFQCVLPLSGTIVAVLCVYYGVARWNDYFTGLVMLRDRSKLPLQTILREILATLQISSSSDQFFSAYADNMGGITEALRKAEVAKYCCIIISTGPAVLLYLFMQKYFVKGVMIGSLKG
jgi:putative aldouronate transport system permease protein